MRNFMMVAGFVFALSGCGKKDGIDGAMSEADGFKDKMCACTDKPCAEKVQADFREWRKGMKDKMKDAADKMTDDQKKHASESQHAMRDCERKLMGDDMGGMHGGTMGGGTPPPAPPTEGSAMTPPAGSAAPAPATP